MNLAHCDTNGHTKIIRVVAPEFNRPPEPVRKEEKSSGDPDYLNDTSDDVDVEDELTFAGMSVEILGRYSVLS